MKMKLIALLAVLTSTLAFGHGDVELGPNGGRILEFSKNETMHGEVTAKDGKFHIAVLDKDMKPVAIEKQSLSASDGDRDNPQKLAVEVKDNHFVMPVVKAGQWLIVRFKLTPDSKPITARMEYITDKCGECKKEEWLCACAAKKK